MQSRSMTCGIYKLTHIESGLVYIGQSKDIEQRWTQHRYSALKKPPILVHLGSDPEIRMAGVHR